MHQTIWLECWPGHYKAQSTDLTLDYRHFISKTEETTIVVASDLHY